MLPPVVPCASQTGHQGSIPLVSVNNGSSISFFLQSGLQKDAVTIETSDLNLKSLKDLACNFVDRKVSQGRELRRLRPEGGCSQSAVTNSTRTDCSSLTMASIA